MPRSNEPTPDLHALLHRLLAMRAELVDRLASRFDGGQLALVASVDAALCAVEAEIEARRNDAR